MSGILYCISTELVKQVSTGDYAVAIVFLSRWPPWVLDGDPIELCTPTDGTGYEIGVCALILHLQENAKNACTFLDWMTSARGQECYIEAKAVAFRQTISPVQQMDCRRWMSSISFL